jgi:hypothetical protein
MTDCGIKQEGESDRMREYPLWVDFIFMQSDVSVWATIAVGTLRNGIESKPRFERALIETAELARNGRSDSAERLSQLPALIAKHRAR